MEYDIEHPRARASDPITSYITADQAKGLARHHAQKILQCLNECGPLGKDGIARITGIDGVAVARRLPELERNELAKPTGYTVKSNTGRPEREWVSVQWLSRLPR